MSTLWTWTAALTLVIAPLACTSAESGAGTQDEGPAPTSKAAAAASQPADAGGASTEGGDATRRVEVEVTASGYAPDTVEVKAGQPITLVFTRTTDKGCGEKLVFPDLDIERDLPLDEAVPIELTPKADQRIAFTCGMGMYEGSVVAVR